MPAKPQKYSSVRSFITIKQLVWVRGCNVQVVVMSDAKEVINVLSDPDNVFIIQPISREYLNWYRAIATAIIYQFTRINCGYGASAKDLEDVDGVEDELTATRNALKVRATPGHEIQIVFAQWLAVYVGLQVTSDKPVGSMHCMAPRRDLEILNDPVELMKNSGDVLSRIKNGEVLVSPVAVLAYLTDWFGAVQPVSHAFFIDDTSEGAASYKRMLTLLKGLTVSSFPRSSTIGAAFRNALSVNSRTTVFGCLQKVFQEEETLPSVVIIPVQGIRPYIKLNVQEHQIQMQRVTHTLDIQLQDYDEKDSVNVASNIEITKSRFFKMLPAISAVVMVSEIEGRGVVFADALFNKGHEEAPLQYLAVNATIAETVRTRNAEGGYLTPNQVITNVWSLYPTSSKERIRDEAHRVIAERDGTKASAKTGKDRSSEVSKHKHRYEQNAIPDASLPQVIPKPAAAAPTPAKEIAAPTPAKTTPAPNPPKTTPAALSTPAPTTEPLMSFIGDADTSDSTPSPQEETTNDTSSFLDHPNVRRGVVAVMDDESGLVCYEDAIPLDKELSKKVPRESADIPRTKPLHPGRWFTNGPNTVVVYLPGIVYKSQDVKVPLRDLGIFFGENTVVREKASGKTYLCCNSEFISELVLKDGSYHQRYIRTSTDGMNVVKLTEQVCVSLVLSREDLLLAAVSQYDRPRAILKELYNTHHVYDHPTRRFDDETTASIIGDVVGQKLNRAKRWQSGPLVEMIFSIMNSEARELIEELEAVMGYACVCEQEGVLYYGIRKTAQSCSATHKFEPAGREGLTLVPLEGKDRHTAIKVPPTSSGNFINGVCFTTTQLALLFAVSSPAVLNAMHQLVSACVTRSFAPPFMNVVVTDKAEIYRRFTEEPPTGDTSDASKLTMTV